MIVRPSVKTPAKKGRDDGTQADQRQGQPASTLAASRAVQRDYNEAALIHQVVTAYQANGAGTRSKTRGEVNKSHKKPWRQKGTGRARGRGEQPAVARRRQDLPMVLAGRELLAEGQPQDVPARASRRSCRSWCARSVSQGDRVDRGGHAEDRQFAKKMKGWACGAPCWS